VARLVVSNRLQRSLWCKSTSNLKFLFFTPGNDGHQTLIHASVGICEHN